MNTNLRAWCDGANTSGSRPRTWYIVHKGQVIGSIIAMDRQQAVERYRLLERDIEDITAEETQEVGK